MTNRVKLTKRLVEAAAPGAILWDDEVRGLHLKVTKAGHRSFLFYYRTKSGQQRRPAVGDFPSMTVENAREVAREWAVEVRKGNDPSQDRKDARRAPTVDDLRQRHLADYAALHLKPRSLTNIETLWRLHIIPKLGTKKVAEVTTDDIADLHTAIGKDHPANANQVRALLSKAFNLAEKWKWRPQHSNPCRHVTAFKIKKRRARLLPQQAAALWQAMQAFAAKPGTLEWRFVGLILLLIITGARLREIMHGRFEEIDWDRKRLFAPDSKRGPREIVLPPRAVLVLQELKRHAPPGNPYIIAGKRRGRPMINPGPMRNRLYIHAGITPGKKGLVLHDLRRTFASAVSSAGHSLKSAGDLLGHSQASTTQGYAWLFDDAAGSVATDAEAKLLSWMESPAQQDVTRTPQ